MGFNYDSSDPLAVVTAPPPNETPEEKAARDEREAEAQKISDQIDEELRAEKAALKKQEQVVKVLLLGQSESGKSTSVSSREYFVRSPSTSRSFSKLTADRLVVRMHREIYHPQELVTRLNPSLSGVLKTCARFSDAIRKGQVDARACLLENCPTA